MNHKYILVIICCCLYIGACNGTANAFGTFIIPMSQQTGACIILYTATSDFMLMAGAFIMGTVYGNQVTTPALIRHVYGNKQYPDVYAGQSVPYGLMYFGSMMYGYVYDFTGSYKLCFLIGIGFLIIAMLLNYYILHKYEKEKNSAL